VRKSTEAELEGRDYAPTLPEDMRWKTWASAKNDDGTDRKDVLTGEDLITFVNQSLFPTLKKYREDATSPDTIEYKVGEIFSEITNKFRSGYSLRDVLEIVDGLEFSEVYFGTTNAIRAGRRSTAKRSR
jgi:type I restriction enzyme M protein